MRLIPERAFHYDDVQSLFRRARARTWDDLLRFLDLEAPHLARFTPAEITHLRQAITTLQAAGQPFPATAEGLWNLLAQAAGSPPAEPTGR
jgi:hypothetical protein